MLDSGAVSLLSARTPRSLALVRSLHAEGLWPPVVHTMVLVESLPGRAGRDANTNRLVKTCVLDEEVPENLARRAAELRRAARPGSAIDALLVALAEPGGTVLTGDNDDMEALAAHARDVHVEPI